MKRYLGVFLALVLLLVGLAAVASAAVTVLWKEDVPYLADGETIEVIEFTGWREGKFEDDSSWTYWFYSEGKGQLPVGWKQIGGKWYYFNPGCPYMVTGSAYDPDKGAAYLMDQSGVWTGLSATKEGWISKGGNWYYVQKEFYWYWDEEAEESYQSEDSYLNFVVNGVTEIGDKYYGFDKNGKMVTGWFQPFKDYDWDDNYWRRAWFYAKADGSLAEGWLKIGGDWYYFDEGGRMRDEGMTWVDDKGYAMDYRSGKMLSGQWFLDTWLDYDGELIVSDSWYYLGTDGVAKTGWFKVGKNWYYANKWGRMLTGWLLDGETMYYLKDTGEMAANEWIEDEDIWYYIKGNGAMAENEWIQDGSAWYWLKDGGDMAHGETVTINGKDYKFADNGVWIP